jgi:alpha-mannosidase
LEKFSEFMPKAMAEAEDLAVWVGELYLELHRGTYTTQAATKMGNRKSEFLLRDAEYFDAVSYSLAPHRKENAASPARAVYDVAGRQPVSITHRSSGSKRCLGY